MKNYFTDIPTLRNRIFKILSKKLTQSKTKKILNYVALQKVSPSVFYVAAQNKYTHENQFLNLAMLLRKLILI